MRSNHRLYLLFADLLEYPSPGLNQRVDECAQLLEKVNPHATELFAEFQSWVRDEPLSHAEETYTSTFDLQGTCCPYAGHYLFGDNYQRSWFMARLNKAYHEKGYSCGKELPDHVTAILRFLALGGEDEFNQGLLLEGLIPSLEKMLQSFSEDGHHPYAQLLRSLLLQLDEGNMARVEEVLPEVGGLKDD